MYYFCTYFDKNYLTRGLALYRSLKEHCPEFTLWVLCMDSTSFEIINKINVPELHPISLEDFELNDEELLGAKKTRSTVEYYFTCTPSLPLYVLNNWSEVDLITYLDADLFFFSSPLPLFEEIGNNSIAIIGHRFPSHLRDLESFGIFNVGWLTFKRDSNGLACLKLWRQQCVEWCYDREEDNRFADQKYLDDWPKRYENVAILEHKGANLAPWNLSNFNLHFSNPERISVDDQLLIFYHFNGLKKINNFFYNPDLSRYGNKLSKSISKKIYSPYLKVLSETDDILSTKYDANLDEKNIRSNLKDQENKPSLSQRAVSHFEKSIFLLKGIFAGRLIFFLK